jgi:hypothetical protein
LDVKANARRIHDVVIGQFLGFGEDGPLVTHGGSQEGRAVTARTLAELTPDMAGCDVALLFEEGDPARPLIVGRVVEPTGEERQAEILRDGERVVVTGRERIELRCGKATIVMEKDGHITIRGTYLVSHASAANRIRGGSVNLN